MCRREAGEPRPQSCRCRFELRSRCEFLGHARLGATLRPPCPQRAVVARHVASPMRLFGVARDPAGRRGLSVPSARTHRTHRAGGSSRTPCGTVGWGPSRPALQEAGASREKGLSAPKRARCLQQEQTAAAPLSASRGHEGEVALCWVPGCRPCATANLGSVLGEAGIFNPDLSTGHGAAVPDPGEGCQPRWQRPGEGHFTPLPTPKFCIIFHFRIRKCRPL